MIPAIHGLALALGSSLAASILAKATVIAVFGLVGARLARRNRAALRHVVLSAMFAVLLWLPVVSIITPPVRIAVPVVGRSDKALPPPAGAIDPIPSLAVSHRRSAITPVNSRPSKPSLAVLLIAAWLAGVALSLIPVVVGLWKIRRVRRSGLPWAHGQALVARLALESGIGRRVSLMVHEALPGPIASGMLHPAILLPLDAQTWDREELNRALVHELEHVRRGDSLINCLARAVCAVYWFHPLVWMAWRQLALEAERSCDDVVLGRSAEATAYAGQLVGLARRLSLASKSAHLAMANHRDLAIRVGAVLDSRQRRGRAGGFLVAFGCAAAAVLILTMSPLRIVSALPSPSARRAADSTLAAAMDASSPTFKVVSVKRSRREENSLRQVTPDGITFIDLPPEELIEIAYGKDFGDFGFRDLKNDQLLGGPSWARNWLGPEGLNYEGYDVVAKVDESLARRFGEDRDGHLFWNGRCPYRHEMLLMFQSLLAERFKLKLRRETREVPIYALVVAQKDPKILHTKFALPPPPCPADMHCLQAYTSMPRLAEVFSERLDRPVVDQTGLNGGYHIKLQWLQKPSVAGTHIAPNFASTAFMFAALEQQMGLKLEPTQGPVDFLVIEHIERPTEN